MSVPYNVGDSICLVNCLTGQYIIAIQRDHKKKRHARTAFLFVISSFHYICVSKRFGCDNK